MKAQTKTKEFSHEKIINQPEHVVDEMLKGLVFMHQDLVERIDGFDVIIRKAEKLVKSASSQEVALVTNLLMQALSARACCPPLYVAQYLPHQHQTKS